MKIDVNEVIVNRITGTSMKELVPGQNTAELEQSGLEPERRDMTVGAVMASALLHPIAAQVDGKMPKPENVRERYKLANRILDAMDTKGTADLNAKEAATIQETVCMVYPQATISGKICEVLDG